MARKGWFGEVLGGDEIRRHLCFLSLSGLLLLDVGSRKVQIISKKDAGLNNDIPKVGRW